VGDREGGQCAGASADPPLETREAHEDTEEGVRGVAGVPGEWLHTVSGGNESPQLPDGARSGRTAGARLNGRATCCGQYSL